MSVKLERIADALIEQISYIIKTEVKNKDINFVTITDAKVTSDLSQAKIYFTVLDDSKKETTLKDIVKNDYQPQTLNELVEKINIL